MAHSTGEPESATNRDTRRLSVWAAMAVSIVIVVASAVPRFQADDFRRFIETDELITVQNYSWPGVLEDGSRRELTFDDISGSPDACSPKRFAIGVYCSLGRWTEPNNHVVHSLLTGISAALWPDMREAIRLPALLAAAGFAVLLAWLCCEAGWYWSAPLVAAVAFWHPFVAAQSQTSRGYALALCLAALWVALLIRFLRRPNSYLLQVAMVLAAVAAFQTLVNLILNWVLPAYVLAILVPGWLAGRSLSKEASRLVRRGLALQLLCVLLVAFVFFVDRLPYAYSSMRQYGLPISGVSDGAKELLAAIQFLFPGRLLIVAALGAVGVAIAIRSRPGRAMTACFAFALLASVCYYHITSRYAYYRNFSIFLPVVFFGIAAVTDWLVRTQRQGIRRGIVVLVTCGVLTGAAWPELNSGLADADVDRLVDRLNDLRGSGDTPALFVRVEPVTDSVEICLPDAWSRTEIPEVPDAAAIFDVVWLEKAGAADGESGGMHAGWPGRAVEQIGAYTLTRCPSRAREAALGPLTADTRLVLWEPDFAAVAISPEPVLNALREHGLVFREINNRYQAKLEVFSRLQCVLIDVSPEARGAVALDRSLAGLTLRFGGSMTLIEPADVLTSRALTN